MSQLETLEEAVGGAISAIQAGGQDVFAVARGASSVERSAVVAELRRERKPAALVAYDGRRVASGEVPESLRFAIFVADESLRTDGEARIGGIGVAGGFDLLERLTLALQDTTIAGEYRLVFVDESPFATDARMVIYRQRYDAQRPAEINAPTFDGQVLCGSGSVVNVIAGSPRRSVVTFGFPGIDTVFRHDLGSRGRPLVWRGQLRADDDTALNAIEQTIEAYVADPRAFEMIDAWSRTFTDCVLDQFERRGPRRKDCVTGRVLQNFELLFEQLSG